VTCLILNFDINQEIKILLRKLESSQFTDYDYYILRNNLTNYFFKFFKRTSPFIEFFEIADRTLSLTASPLFHEKFGSKPVQNPKTLLLTMMACTNLAKAGSHEYLNKTKKALQLLQEKYIQECNSESIFVGAPFKHWYSFDSSNPRFFAKDSPNLYLTSLLGKALIELASMDSSFDSLAMKVANFLVRPECYVNIEGKPFFKYYLGKDTLLVHNANTSASSLLIRMSQNCANKSEEILAFRKFGEACLRSSISEINTDGSLPYFSKFDPKRYSPKEIDNFHTGFVICDLIDVFNATKNDFYKKIALKCLKFYSTMFDDKGLPSYTPFKRYPIDIHNCAVGIITFSKASIIDKSFISTAEKICASTIDTFLDKDGQFYYQKYPLKVHRGKFLRWNQAWMFLALSQLIMNGEYNQGNYKRIKAACLV
jgi:hypothetical protein